MLSISQKEGFFDEYSFKREVTVGEEMVKRKQSHMFCKACGDQVNVKFLRSHLCTHNPNADNLTAEEVRDCYQLADPSGDQNED